MVKMLIEMVVVVVLCVGAAHVLDAPGWVIPIYTALLAIGMK